jgi:hypothetical protein
MMVDMPPLPPDSGNLTASYTLAAS